MESGESPLDVLSRAAIMVQDNILPPSYGSYSLQLFDHCKMYLSAQVNVFLMGLMKIVKIYYCEKRGNMWNLRTQSSYACTFF